MIEDDTPGKSKLLVEHVPGVVHHHQTPQRRLILKDARLGQTIGLVGALEPSGIDHEALAANRTTVSVAHRRNNVPCLVDTR